jgi:hypothetical protein
MNVTKVSNPEDRSNSHTGQFLKRQKKKKNKNLWLFNKRGWRDG